MSAIVIVLIFLVLAVLSAAVIYFFVTRGKVKASTLGVTGLANLQDLEVTGTTKLATVDTTGLSVAGHLVPQHRRIYHIHLPPLDSL